jgi:cytochrome c biogenesis protein CcmG/thiol:disulfide interchange protein DsbE
MDKNNSAQLNSWVDDRLASLNSTNDWQPNAAAARARLNELQRKGSWLTKRWTWAAAAAISVCLCFLILPAPRVLAHRCLECTVAVWQTLSASGPVQAELIRENDRKSAPDFTLQDANGREVKLSSLKGKVVLVNFWATWCEGCQVEIPWLVEFQKIYQARGLVVIGVSLDDDGWKSVKPWIKEKNVNYSVVIGGDDLAKQYHCESMPLTVLIDRDGKIACVHPGLVDKDATGRQLSALLQVAAKPSAN